MNNHDSITAPTPGHLNNMCKSVQSTEMVGITTTINYHYICSLTIINFKWGMITLLLSGMLSSIMSLISFSESL